MTTRFRGLNWTYIGIDCAPGYADDPTYDLVSWYGYYGSIKVTIRGRTRGYEIDETTCNNGWVTSRGKDRQTWGRREQLTITVTTSGLVKGTTGIGPWAVKIGIPVPRR